MQLGNQGREVHLFNWQEFDVPGLACKLIICFQGWIEPFPTHAEVTGASHRVAWSNSNGSVF